jgi:hypothetical protein
MPMEFQDRMNLWYIPLLVLTALHVAMFTNCRCISDIRNGLENKDENS